MHVGVLRARCQGLHQYRLFSQVKSTEEPMRIAAITAIDPATMGTKGGSVFLGPILGVVASVEEMSKAIQLSWHSLPWGIEVKG